MFAVLLNFKHIFIYLAPPYLVFLFRAHCFPPPSHSFSPAHLVELGTIVLGVTTLSFGPFLATGGVQGVAQIVSRLFPFQRGLNHAYWAGNVWALVSTVDRVLVRCASGIRRWASSSSFTADLLARGIHVDRAAIHSTSRGLVGDTTFGVVPEITPRTCFSITLAFSLASRPAQVVRERD